MYGNTDNEELEALAARLYPKFMEYVARHAKNIFSADLATSLDGIKTMPALYDKDGVQKQVIAPLSLLTKNVDEKIDEAGKAADKANKSAGKADEAAKGADAAAQKVTDAITDITAEKQAALDAAQKADESADKTDTSRNNIEAKESGRETAEERRVDAEKKRVEAEDGRVNAEKKREKAEGERQATFETNEADRENKFSTALATTDDINAHPGYPGADGYWYRYDPATKAYNKTSTIVKGDAFKITKQYKSVAEMEADDVTQYEENSFMLINTDNVEDEDDAKLYVVDLDADGIKQYDFLCDMSGFRGFTGRTPQLFIGTVQTGVAGSEASVSMTEDGTDDNGNPRYTLSFAIPKGDKGERGEKGEPGDVSEAVNKVNELETRIKDITANGIGMPTKMELDYLDDISTTNKVAQKIKVKLYPTDFPQNYIFQVKEGTSLSVDPSGNLTVKGTGKTVFWVIPTNNTHLWQEAAITVRKPVLLKGNGKLIKANGRLIAV